MAWRFWAWQFWARTRPAQLNAFEDASEESCKDECELIEPLLSLYGDGMASAAEVRLVEAHLPGCESCRESLAWMQATRRALSARPVQSPPADLHARIAEAIAAADAAPLRLRPARTFATRPAFAAAASLAAVGLFLGYSLTHLPHPGVAVKPVPSQSVATAPQTAPAVPVSPVKPTAPAATARKPKPAPLIANANTGPDDAPPAPRVTPEAAPPRAAVRESIPAERLAPKPAPVLTAPPVAPRPRLKPVTPRPTSLVAVKTPAAAKHTPAPLPTKAPVEVARNEGTVKTPDVQVLTPKVIPQEAPAPERTAAVQPDEPRVQTVDFIREVRAHLPSPRKFGQSTVGLSVQGVSAVTRTFGNEGGAQPLASIVHSPLR